MKRVWNFAREVYGEWSGRQAPHWAAAVAYHTIFSLAPVLIIAIAVAGLVVGNETARAGMLTELERFMGEQAAQAVESLLTGFQDRGRSAATIGAGLLVLLWGASNVFITLRNALNVIWELGKKPGVGLKGFFKDRLVSFAVVLSIGFVLLVSLLLSAVLVALRRQLALWLPIPGWMLPAFDLGLSFLVVTFLFTLIFKFLPSVVLRWRDALVGGAATALLFAAGKSLLGYFLGREAMTSPYGAAGSLVLVLLWVNYSAKILFFGACLIKVRARRMGRPLRPGPYSISLAAPIAPARGERVPVARP